MARVAQALAVSWNCANDAVPAEGHRLLVADPDRFDGVTTMGVDEHVWRHTRTGDKFVTVRNVTIYISRPMLEAGGFKPRLHPRS